MHGEATDRPDPQMSAIFARMTVQQRLAVAEGLMDSAREIVAQAVRRDRPAAADAEVRRLIAARFRRES